MNSIFFAFIMIWDLGALNNNFILINKFTYHISTTPGTLHSNFDLYCSGFTSVRMVFLVMFYDFCNVIV